MRAGALVGVVLAGGEGRRMGPGVPKPLRLLGGRPMVAHVVERLRPQVMDLVIVANDPDPACRALGAGDSRSARHPAAALREGRGWARWPASWPAWNGRRRTIRMPAGS